ncbi:DNA-binding response regulator [Dysgonomonas sp. 521]|uniref:response regulator transcription factor n=1 Tax=Dysgonomonas sp. 521 TaxID=2302932 RepID=UPI0013D4AE3A|nr:response regulator transcription factor [Dysgonomonas sp. 521]NDV94494.1 DNA-binding response regulator [Dysgonomonas sp. 521]
MKENTKILICVGNENFGVLLKKNMEIKSYRVELFYNGITANNAFLENDYALCIIDVALPGIDGFSLAKDIKAYQPEIPIIFLADKASNVKEEVLAGLKMGADDYFVKPYDLEILTHRIKAILNRAQKEENPTNPIQVKYSIGDYIYDSEKRILSNSIRAVKLTTKENELLKLLCVNVNKIVSREEALIGIWGKADYFTARSMDVYITKLRKYF